MNYKYIWQNNYYNLEIVLKIEFQIKEKKKKNLHIIIQNRFIMSYCRTFSDSLVQWHRNAVVVNN